MHIQEILTAAIVFIPACYAALVAVQLASGLSRVGKRINAPAVTPIAAVAPQQPATEHIADCVPVNPWTAPSALAEVTDDVAPVATSDQPIALLPAFIANTQEPEYTAADHALVESAMESIAAYWSRRCTDNVVEFKRPVRASQKRLQQHPAIESMTVHQMRRLALDLGMKGAARWNKAQCKNNLTAHYRRVAA